jgi:hypothetical protein
MATIPNNHESASLLRLGLRMVQNFGGVRVNTSGEFFPQYINIFGEIGEKFPLYT